MPTQATSLKTRALIALALLMLLGCAACSGSESVTRTSPATVQSSNDGTTRHQEAAADNPQIVMISGHRAADASYGMVLYAAVKENGFVDYSELNRPATQANLDRAIEMYADAELPAEENARKAFWINAYNANVLRIVIRELQASPTPAEILHIDGIFDQQQITVAQSTMVLNDIEHGKLRSMGDPRIHAALVCGAVSCPPLRREPYDPARLDAQLDDQCRRWINDASKNRMDIAGLSLSMILDWFKSDFAVEPFGDRIGFVRHYADPDGPIGRYLLENPEPAILFEPYDWRINDVSANDQTQP